MKIILHAFGDTMKSKVMDIPENSTTVWKMVLQQPLQAFVDFHGKTTKENAPFDKVCTFEWTGEFYLINDESVRIYVLTNVN